MSDFVTVAQWSDLKNGSAIKVALAGRLLAIFRDNDQLFVLDDECPHKGGPLSSGWIEHGHVYCPLHGWKFELGTGACETNCDKPAKTYPARVLNGEVQVQIG